MFTKNNTLTNKSTALSTIETGRFFNIDRSERHCNLCNVNELGDEFHYLFKCTFFNNARAKFLPRNICNNPNVLKFNWRTDEYIRFIYTYWHNEIVQNCYQNLLIHVHVLNHVINLYFLSHISVHYIYSPYGSDTGNWY